MTRQPCQLQLYQILPLAAAEEKLPAPCSAKLLHQSLPHLISGETRGFGHSYLVHSVMD